MSALITENKLDEWVRGNKINAQGTIVELIGRLVAASCPNPRERRFQWKDSISQHGPDGYLETETDFEPFIPNGKSFWEIGTALNANKKATSDYDNLTKAVPENIRLESTFIFVTPLSGYRGWEYSWKKEGQLAWLQERRIRNEWKDVRVIDGTKLVDWLHRFPAVERWLALKMSLPTRKIDTPEARWEALRTIGNPPLSPNVFIVNRAEACDKVMELFIGKIKRLKIQTYYPYQIVDFVAAYLATLAPQMRAGIAARCLIIEDDESLKAICGQYKDHILIISPLVELSGHEGNIRLEKASRAGHSVIYWALPGGKPPDIKSNEFAISLPQPSVYALSKALQEAGYTEERARQLSIKSGGNLSSLLNILQNLSLVPKWDTDNDAADLVTALLVGGWNENYKADLGIVETLSGEPYNQLITKFRGLALRPNTPMRYQDGKWKFIARYEGWYALGPRIFDEHLDRFHRIIVTVLREEDPKFELPPEDRFAASIYGKVPIYSKSLRYGLAESLALIGSHPKALTSTSHGKAETISNLIVRDILSDADWNLWASLDDVLHLLAEAAPNEFLNNVEKALRKNPGPFDELFAQESHSANYMSGLLWALETLAWDPNHFSRVIDVLGKLANRDTGGYWANRPADSLVAILLPWLPQTCASFVKRSASVNNLLKNHPDVGWKLLLNLLPGSKSVTHFIQRPTWREIIPDNWSPGVTHMQYIEQVEYYSEIAVKTADGNAQRLSDLIDHLHNLPPTARDKLLSYLDSCYVMTLSENDLCQLWTSLTNLINTHRKFADADWALSDIQLDRLNKIAEKLAPKSLTLRYKRLFSERSFDLFTRAGNYEQQEIELQKQREQAIKEIYNMGGIQAVIDFALSVESPWRAGFSSGYIADEDADHFIFPKMLDTEDRSASQFIQGFIKGRLKFKGWDWVDNTINSNWAPNRICNFLLYLPFVPETWERSSRFLGNNESKYWTKTNAIQYEADTGLEIAADKLIEHGRPFAAIRVLYRMYSEKHNLDNKRTVTALLAGLDSSEDKNAIDAYEIVELIKALQNDSNTNKDDLFRIEFAYLPLLDHSRDASPKLLEYRLATDPGFFCEVIRMTYKSKKEDSPRYELTEQMKIFSENAHRLLWNWKTPPGICEDGSYDGNALISWLEEVKKKCSESGHLEIAMEHIGEVLVYAPQDPDGLWIHRTAAEILNTEDSDIMRNGFRVELFNSRGAHWVDPSGKPEMELADKYRRQAEEIEVAGFHRLANTLREFAKEYEREAERIQKNRFEE